jgi:hypothetical protein
VIARAFSRRRWSLLRYTAGESSPPMTDQHANEFEDSVLHAFKNQLTVIVGFCDLLLIEIPEGDRKRDDVNEIRKAAHVALELARQIRPDHTLDTDA